jgi:hypothetical protein
MDLKGRSLLPPPTPFGLGGALAAGRSAPPKGVRDGGAADHAVSAIAGLTSGSPTADHPNARRTSNV